MDGINIACFYVTFPTYSCLVIDLCRFLSRLLPAEIMNPELHIKKCSLISSRVGRSVTFGLKISRCRISQPILKYLLFSLSLLSSKLFCRSRFFEKISLISYLCWNMTKSHNFFSVFVLPTLLWILIISSKIRKISTFTLYRRKFAL